MMKEKAAIFFDNSNIYKGMQAFGKTCIKKEDSKAGSI